MNYIIEQDGNENKTTIKSANYPYFSAFTNFKEANQNEVIIKLPTHIPHLNSKLFNVLALSLEHKPIDEIITDEEFYHLSQIFDFLCIKDLSLNLLLNLGNITNPTQFNDLVINALKDQTEDAFKFCIDKSFIIECNDMKSELFESNDFNWKGIICAGGAILSYLNISPKLKESDIDLYILNNDLDTLKRTLNYFAKENETIFVKRKNVITIIQKGNTSNIQLILCSEKYPENILESFDADYVKAYYDGKYLTITGESMSAWITKTVNIYKKNISHSRIYKALQKGFKFNDNFVFCHPEIVPDNFYSYLQDHPLVTKYSQKYYHLQTTTNNINQAIKDEIAERFLTTPDSIFTDLNQILTSLSISTNATFVNDYAKQTKFNIPMGLITTDLVPNAIIDVTGIVIAGLSVYTPGGNFELLIEGDKTFNIIDTMNKLVQVDAIRQGRGMQFFPLIKSHLTYNYNPVNTVRIKIKNKNLLARALIDIKHGVKLNATLLLNRVETPVAASRKLTYTRLLLVDYRLVGT